MLSALFLDIYPLKINYINFPDYGNYYTGPITLNNTLFFYQKPPSHPFIHSIDFQQQVEEEKYTNIQINQRPISTRRPIINTPTPSVNTPRPSFSFGVLPKPKPQNQQTNSRPHFDITQNKPSTEPSTRPTYSWNKKPSTEITTRPTYSWNKKPSTEVSTRPSRPWNNNPSTRPSYPWSTEVDKNTKYEEELFSIVNNTDNVEITDYHNIKTTTKITIRVNQDICGSTINDIVPLKAAQESQRGSYPWLSALFKQTTNGLTFLCAGNLITKKHVLTGNIQSDYLPMNLTMKTVLYCLLIIGVCFHSQKDMGKEHSLYLYIIFILIVF